MDMWETSTKTMGSSTHTFKNHGCYSTHSTHTNDDPDDIFMVFITHFCSLSEPNWCKPYGERSEIQTTRLPTLHLEYWVNLAVETEKWWLKLKHSSTKTLTILMVPKLPFTSLNIRHAFLETNENFRYNLLWNWIWQIFFVILSMPIS